MGEKHPKLSRKPSHRTIVQLNEPATGHDWSPATRRNSDNLNDNCGHSGEKATSQNDNRSLYLHGLRNWV